MHSPRPPSRFASYCDCEPVLCALSVPIDWCLLNRPEPQGCPLPPFSPYHRITLFGRSSRSVPLLLAYLSVSRLTGWCVDLTQPKTNGSDSDDEREQKRNSSSSRIARRQQRLARRQQRALELTLMKLEARGS